VGQQSIDMDSSIVNKEAALNSRGRVRTCLVLSNVLDNDIVGDWTMLPARML
jgi:hypothetical protein